MTMTLHARSTANDDREELLRAVLAGTQSPLLVLDAAGRVAAANTEAAALFGHADADALAGRAVEELLPEGLPDAQASGGPSGASACTGRHVSGGTLSLAARLTPLAAAGEGVRLLSLQARREAPPQGLEPERLRAVLEGVPDAMILADPQGRVQLCNSAVQRVFGCAPEALLGHPLQSLLAEPPPAGASGAAPDREKTSHHPREALYRRRDGGTFHGESVSTAIQDEAGNTVGYLSLIRDISARKRAENGLRESQRLLRAVLDALPQSLTVKDRQRRIITVNAAGLRRLRRSEAEILHRTPEELDCYLPEERKHIRELDERVLATGEAVEGREVTLQRPGEFPRNYRMSRHPLTDEDGRVVGLVGLRQDVTEQVATLAALRESEQRFRALIEGSIQGIVILRSRKPVFANQAYADIFGFDRPEEVLALDAIDVLEAPEERERIVAYARARLEGREAPSRYEFRGLRRDGTVIWLECISRVVEWEGRPAIQSILVDITDRKEAEAALSNSRQILREVIDALPQAVFLKDLQGAYLMVNRPLAAFFGLEPEALVGRRLDELGVLPADQAQRLIELDAEAIQQRQKVYETRLSDAHGNTQVRRVYKMPHRDHEGRVVGVVGISEDVTEQVRSEEALRASERLLQAVFDAIPQEVFVKDVNGQYLKVNRTWADHYGVEPEDCAGLTTDTLPGMPPEAIEVFLRTDRQVQEAGRRVDVPSLSMQRGGREEVRSIVKLPLLDDEGRVTGIVGMAQDITERTRAEEELRASQRLLQTVFDLMPMWVFVKDAEGRLLMVNRRMAEELGVDRDTALLDHPHFISPRSEAEREAVQRLDAQVMTSGQPVEADELSWSLPNGDQRVFRTVRVPLRDESGSVVGLVGLNEDVTERYRTEQAMQQAQKLESLGVLAGGVAHDFNNLLVAIMGNASLARMEAPSGSQVGQALEQIETAGQRAADLCAQMLAYAGQGHTETAPLRLNELILEMGQLLGVSMPKHVEIDYDFQPELSAVEGDATQIRQVVMNLVINAAEAIGDQTGRITLRTGEVEADGAYLAGFMGSEALRPGRYALLEVRDSGAGMTPEQVRRVFDPFFTTKFTGRGLGLAAVLGIVRSHQGGLQVESTPGSGSVFRLLLPISEASPDEQQEPPPSGAWHGSGTVLVVDDEPAVREVAVRMLATLGLQAVEADSAQEALRLAKERGGTLDAVLLDVTMPEMGGEEALERLRTERPALPVLMMSGYSEQELGARFAGRGAAGFLQKPFRFGQIEARLRAVLEG